MSHSKKPSRGYRRLPFQPDADAELEPIVDCLRLEPVPRARPHRGRSAAMEGYEVCGVRLLRWTLADADRLELAALAQKTVAGKKWVQVVLDPSINRRAWLQFAPGRAGEPLMRLRRLGDWIASARRGVVPGHAARFVTLRDGPSPAGEPAARQLPKEGDDVPVDVLGVQGDWIRLAAQGEDCERADGEDAGACPAGWTNLRATDGQPVVLP
ncbi:MAG: hypothetical protein HY925_06250 [Elusimicrobia bacterium]|nr:hypothetical protein [Elusimicrobiota bacterium]